MRPFQFRTGVLTACAVSALVYALYITAGNLAHIRAMPTAEREPLMNLPLPDQVRIVESVSNDSSATGDTLPHDENLVRRDIHVRIGQINYPMTPQAWVRLDRPQDDRLRYLSRFRAGLLRDGAELRMYLIEVPQAFADSGDQTRLNLWQFEVTRNADEVLVTSDQTPTFAPNITLTEAQSSETWRPVFAHSYRRLVRAFPALAAFVVALAAIGSLVFALWRSQPWAVAATTVTFVLPMVSAAPFLTAFGWLPLVAAVTLGFVLTTAIVCAIEQRALSSVLGSIRTTWLTRVVEALAIPLAALLVGTTLVTSLASVSVIEWQGLGSASPGEIFMASLIRPAIGLLAGGMGVCLVLALFYGLLRFRIDQRRKTPV